MTFLNFEPSIYVPYELSLRKQENLILDEMIIENGEVVDLSRVKPKASRMPNRNYIVFDFNNPLYMDVSPVVGTDAVITFLYTYRLQLDKEVIVKHRQHVANNAPTRTPGRFCHYTTQRAAPAIFGMEKARSLSMMLASRASQVAKYCNSEWVIKHWGQIG